MPKDNPPDSLNLPANVTVRQLNVAVLKHEKLRGAPEPVGTTCLLCSLFAQLGHFGCTLDDLNRKQKNVLPLAHVFVFDESLNVLESATPQFPNSLWSFSRSA